MSMQSYMANDLAELYTRDMPAQCRIGNVIFAVLLNDEVGDELDAYGGPERIEMQEVRFLTRNKKEIDDGSTLQVRQNPSDRWMTKIVLRSTISADGNELIVTARGN